MSHHLKDWAHELTLKTNIYENHLYQPLIGQNYLSPYMQFALIHSFFLLFILFSFIQCTFIESLLWAKSVWGCHYDFSYSFL